MLKLKPVSTLEFFPESGVRMRPAHDYFIVKSSPPRSLTYTNLFQQLVLELNDLQEFEFRFLDENININEKKFRAWVFNTDNQGLQVRFEMNRVKCDSTGETTIQGWWFVVRGKHHHHNLPELFERIETFFREHDCIDQDGVSVDDNDDFSDIEDESDSGDDDQFVCKQYSLEDNSQLVHNMILGFDRCLEDMADINLAEVLTYVERDPENARFLLHELPQSFLAIDSIENQNYLPIKRNLLKLKYELDAVRNKQEDCFV